LPVKIAEIPYLNCAPFYWRREAFGDCEWVSASPRELGRKAARGGLDAGPLSLVDSFALAEDFEPLGNFGIASGGKARSVLFFSRVPWEELGGLTVGLTPDSATSSELLKLILSEWKRARPAYREGIRNGDSAWLLIGDAALKAARAPGIGSLYPHVYDLGEEWRKWQGLPFVFARWLAGKRLDRSVKGRLASALAGNLEGAGRDFGPALDWFEKSAGWAEPGGRDYLAGFTYRLGRPEERSISLFRDIMKKSLVGRAPRLVSPHPAALTL